MFLGEIRTIFEFTKNNNQDKRNFYLKIDYYVDFLKYKIIWGESKEKATFYEIVSPEKGYNMKKSKEIALKRANELIITFIKNKSITINKIKS